MHGRPGRIPARTGCGRIPLRPVDEAAMAKALPGNTAARPIIARPGVGHKKKESPGTCLSGGLLWKGRLPTFPLSQYHRRGEV